MVSNQSGTKWLNAGFWNFNSSNTLPSQIHLPTLPQGPLKSIKKPQSLLLDFGKETFGFIKLHGLEGKGNVGIYYGESQEEAQAIESCETLDRLQIDL